MDPAAVWDAVGDLSDLGPGLDDAGRIEMIEVLESLKSAACAAQARLAVDFDASQRAEQEAAGVRRARVGVGVAAQVGLARRESPHRGGRLLGLAKALVREMPHTLRALESGALNEWRATLIVRETACLPAEDRTAVDADLWADPAAVAALGDRGLAGRVRSLSYERDPIAVTQRAAKAEQERTVTIRPAPDTMAYLTGLLPVGQAVAAYAALKRSADQARAAGDERSRAQVMADTLVHALTGIGAGEPVPVQVSLVMSDDTLLAGGHEPAQIPGYGPIPAGVARRLVADASARAMAWLRRVYTHPETGRLVGMEARSRCFPEGLADFLDLRDQVCRTPWCDAPIRHHDHVRGVSRGGATIADNGQGLCEACNYAKEAPGWRARADPAAGLVTTVTPTGNTYVSPEPVPPGRPPPRATSNERHLFDLVWDHLGEHPAA